MNRQQRLQYAREVERINRKYEVLFQPSVLRALKSKVKGVTSRLKESGTDEAMRFLDSDLGNIDLSNRIRTLYRIVGLRHANRVYADLRQQQREAKKGLLSRMEVKRFGFNETWSNAVINYLNRFLLEKITFEVNDTTKRAILKVLTEGINEGLSIDEMVKRLEDLPFLRYQTARIVRTEIKRAAEAGASEGAKSFQFEQNKVWISLHDNRVRGTSPKDRADHRGLDGQTVDEKERFKDPRNGDLLLFPGDPEGQAASTINCRCTVAYVARRDENDRLIPKKSRVSVIMPGDFNRQRQTITI